MALATALSGSSAPRLVRRLVAASIAMVIVAGVAVAVFKPPHPAVRGASSVLPQGRTTGGTGAGGATPSEATQGGAAGAGVPAIGPPATQPAAPADTVVRTGSLDIQVAKHGFSSAFSAAADVARQAGGFVVTAQSGPAPAVVDSGSGAAAGATVPASPSTGDTAAPTWGQLLIRVPGTHFDDARKQLEGLGTVGQEQLAGQDAGGQLADLTARLVDLHAQQEQLRALLKKTSNTADVLAIQSQIATIQQQIDGLTAQLNGLHNQVTLATLTVTVHEPPVVVPGPGSVLSQRIAQARRGVEAVLGGILVVLAYAGPLALLAGMGAVGVAAHRRRRSQRVAPIA